MNAIRISMVCAAALAVALAAPSVVAAPKAKAKTNEAAKPVGEPVEYAALEERVGQTIAVDTTLKTTREGKLLKWTQPALTMQLESNGLELTVPRETIKAIRVIASPEPTNTKDAGTSGAKKN
jgi:hypothetical protein